MLKERNPDFSVCSPRACARLSASKLADYTRGSLIAALLISSATLLGCGSSKSSVGTTTNRKAPTPAPQRQTSPQEARGADLCAARLHDICGLFLLYDLKNHRLPEKLDDLRDVPGFNEVGEFVCPFTNKPYTYDPNGRPSPSGAGRVIVYDSVASHSGMRLCITIVEPQQGQALVAKVISIPESFFSK